MGLGEAIKSDVDNLRQLLGTPCTLNGADIGKCSKNELNPAQIRETIGSDYEDEIGLSWCVFEVSADHPVKVQDRITETITGQNWVVRRVSVPQAAGVILAYRCLCVVEMI